MAGGIQGRAVIRHCGSALALFSWSTSAAAQLAVPQFLAPEHYGLVANVPQLLVKGRSPKLALRADSRLLSLRATPLLDSLFNDRDTVSRSVRRRGYRLELGTLALGVEALRLQARTTDLLSVRSDNNRPRKSWAMGITSDWAVGADDRLSLGFAAGSYRNPPPTAVETDPRAATSLKRLALTWARGDQWRLGLGWQKDGGSSRGASDRIVEIANGAPLHEQGMRLAISFLPGGNGDPHQTAVGFEARRATVSSADVAVIGSGVRKDLQETLYFRRQF